MTPLIVILRGKRQFSTSDHVIIVAGFVVIVIIVVGVVVIVILVIAVIVVIAVLALVVAFSRCHYHRSHRFTVLFCSGR